MKKPVVVVVATFVVLIAFGGGYFVGDRNAYGRGLDRLRHEVAGNIGLRVESLSRLRIGDTHGGIAWAEQNLDRAISTVTMGQRYDDLPGGTQRALVLAKVYRMAFPSNDESVAVVLADVPLVSSDHEYCSPAIGRIAALAHGR